MNSKLILNIVELSKALSDGNYSQRIITDYDENPLNQIITHLNALADKLLINPPKVDDREAMQIEHFTNTISSYACSDFTNKLPISKNATILDAIATGINLLGEELEQTTISRDYFSNIYDAVSEILIITDVSGKILDVNAATEKLLLHQKKKFINRNVVGLLDPKNKLLKEEISNKIKKGCKDCSICSNCGVFETILFDKAGKAIPFSFILSKIRDGNSQHEGFLLIFRDISEQKNKKINDLKIIIAEQEKERNRIANDLHDSLGQELNAIKIFLHTLTLMDPTDPNFKKTLETCQSLSNKSIESIREISFDIMPRSLKEGGLIYALDEIITKLNSVCNISCSITHKPLNLNTENQILIFRIIQEFINNSLRHTSGSQISLTLTIIKKRIHILIKDNGSGFKMNDETKGNGIHNIISRLTLLKAEYEFNSELGKGTKLSFSVPNE
ncbi:PAS domain-containing sensor histidine kinase [Flavobacterium psychrotolerans]|uniref:histidine kinase n=1 Tax=Flavobacterium psychrotolerans TaxID=2169410 RepID=A0A2U1JGX0_9FLAO|nr:PAS domain-containing sensor histidine kinase [Flavobacterium psychrotolerans]PWA04386.1 hypothetical protein DB895_11580 [Flavobacterium psychrotolerans]